MSRGSYLGGSSIVRVKVESSKGLKTFLDRMRNKNNKLSDTEYELKLERIVESMGITQRSVQKRKKSTKGKSVHRSGKGPLNKFETKKRDTTDFQNKILKVDVRRGKKRVVKDVEVVIDNPKKIVIPR